MSQDVRLDYTHLLVRFRKVRRAWKRAAVLSGLVVVIIEAAGAFTVAVMANLLFAPSRPERVGLIAAALLATAFFAAHHIIRPLFRRIGHRQLALYLEEHNPEFEGALIAAAEFGPDSSFQGRQAQIIESILHEAARRAERFDIYKAIDLKRLRKYAVVATCVVAGYLAAALLMPETVGRRLVRVIDPWRPTPEEVAAALKAQPIHFTLSRDDGDLLRGSTFDVEAALSRQPAESVAFYFRPLALRRNDSAWKSLPMKELEKINTYQATLPDVNDDFEFYVATGTDHSSTHQIGVYDPLIVKAIQITTKYPDYMRLPDHVDNADQPDVAAPIGSTVTLHITTNRPLAGGELLWQTNAKIAGTVDTAHPECLDVKFPVGVTATFQYQINDVKGQVNQSLTNATLTAVVDKPPTIKLLKPGSAYAGNALSDIEFLADVTDDFGLDGGDLVVVRSIDGTITEQRMPLAFDNDLQHNAVTAAKATATLSLKTLTPVVQPGETFMCHLEARDRKGQPAYSELTMVDVTPFAAWAYFIDEAEHHHHHAEYDLEPILTATWRLDHARDDLAPREFTKQTDAIAADMVDPDTGQLHEYFNPEHATEQQKKHGAKAMQLAGAAHGDLVQHDTGKALQHLQLAMVELKLAGYMENLVQHQPMSEPAGGMHLTTAEVTHLQALMNNTPNNPDKAPETKHDETAAAAHAAKAQELANAQAKVVQQMEHNAAQAGVNPQPAAVNPKPADAQNQVAEKTQALADAVRNAAHDQEHKDAAGKLAMAAQAMRDAALAANQDQALAQARAALQHMTEASTQLNVNSQERINQLLDQAAGMAQALHGKQAEVQKQTQAAATQPSAVKPLADAQIDVANGLQKLKETVDALAKINAAGGLKPATAKHVDEAIQEIKHSRLEQQITDAALELAAQNAANAAPHQAKALAALAHVKDELLAASTSRGTDLTTALAQAKAQAKELQHTLEKMGAKPPDAAAPEHTTDHPGQPDGKALANQAANQAALLAAQLAARDFAGKDHDFAHDIATLAHTVQVPAQLANDLKKVTARDDLANLTGRLSNKLEAAYAADLASKRIFDAQREACPPQYRQLVNAYFEALSKQPK